MGKRSLELDRKVWYVGFIFVLSKKKSGSIIIRDITIMQTYTDFFNTHELTPSLSVPSSSDEFKLRILLHFSMTETVKVGSTLPFSSSSFSSWSSSSLSVLPRRTSLDSGERIRSFSSDSSSMSSKSGIVSAAFSETQRRDPLEKLSCQ